MNQNQQLEQEPLVLNLDSLLDAIRNSHVEQESFIDELTAKNTQLVLTNERQSEKITELTKLVNQAVNSGDTAIQQLTQLKGELKRLKSYGDPKALATRAKNTKKKNDELVKANTALQAQNVKMQKELKALRKQTAKVGVSRVFEGDNEFMMVMPFLQNVRVHGEDRPDEYLNERPVLAWWSQHGLGRFLVPNEQNEPIVAKTPPGKKGQPSQDALDFARGYFEEIK